MHNCMTARPAADLLQVHVSGYLLTVTYVGSPRESHDRIRFFGFLKRVKQ